ncbi:MAG: hypothetical protein E6G74_10105 [Alphaproteobacteria bacterium]|nr:MAG: hypothetical protein E6G74_10105 [Alphaproteobacteria bacterium]
MERACERSNLRAALKRVRENAGKPGIDGMTVEELSAHLRVHWPRLREELLAGRYQPQPVRRVAIPKPGGGERELGIPTVLDRFIQQALLQVLQPLFDPTFSDASYGFRPGRRAHDAVRRAQAYVQEGRSFVVDIDLEKFLNRVSYCPLVHEAHANSSLCRAITLMRSPFCRPRMTWTASSSPRLTRCNTVWRETPRARIASRMGRKPSATSALKRAFSSSVRRMRQGAPGVICSPAMKPSLRRRWIVDGATPSAMAARLMVMSSPSAAPAFGTKHGIFQ